MICQECPRITECNLLERNTAGEGSAGRIAVSRGAAMLAAEMLELGECSSPQTDLCANTNSEQAGHVIDIAANVLGIES